MEIRRDVFQAIADPTRRKIIGLVAKEPLNLNAIAENFDSSRQAISLHIKILTECGLLVIKNQGRERVCQAKFQKLNEVSAWVEQYKEFWEKRLDKFDSLVQELKANEKKNVRTRSTAKSKRTGYEK
jgi:DNA-binding transcriptional ArsR family regulator